MRTEQEMVAYALEIDEALLPFIPELLQDFDELGSDAGVIVNVLDELNLSSSIEVIDLGCGKGAVSVEIAVALGLQILGVDLFEPFISICEARAAAEGVSHLCTFQHGDIMKLVNQIKPVDVAVYAALGDVLGPLDMTMDIIRQFVKPGGYIVINDDYLKEGANASSGGFETVARHEETIRRLQAHGDLLLKEVLEPEEEMVEFNTKMSHCIRQRAETLAKRHPDLKDAFMEFADDQAEEYAFIESSVVPAVWLIQRADS